AVHTATGPPCSPPTAASPASFSVRSRWAWSGSTSPSPCPCPTTPSADGRTPSSAATPSMGPRVFTSTPGRRSSAHGGRTRSTGASTWDSRHTDRGPDTTQSRASLPTGTVTFLFTDIEGSTLMVQRLGERWAEVLARHDAIVTAAIDGNRGRVVKTDGDSFFA